MNNRTNSANAAYNTSYAAFVFLLYKFVILVNMKNTIILTLGLAYASYGLAETDVRPNVLFCLADDVSFPYWGAYGCSWVRTPNIDKLASQGMLFMNAYTCNAKSGPSRSCILTGRNSWQLEAACNHFAFWPQEFKTFAEVLRENGYSVAKTGKGWAPGNPGMINGKRRELIGESFDKIKLQPLTTEISPIDYAANFSQFLDTRDKSKPFFFWYGSLEPHRFYEYGSAVSKGNYKPESIDDIPPYWPDCLETRNDMLDFALELEHFDTHLGAMIDKLAKEGLLENTIIIVTADNGMPFPRIKGQAYHHSNHLPMLVYWQGTVKEGVKNTDFVNFIDLAPTFLDVAGIDGEEKGMQQIEGKSLLPLIKSGKNKFDNSRDYVLIGKERHDIGRPNDEGYPIRGIVTYDYLYIYNFEPGRWPAGNPETGYLNCDGGAIKTELIKDGMNRDRKYWTLNFGKRPQEELYDIVKDPYCMNNLINSAEGQKVAENLRKKMFTELSKQGDHRIMGDSSYYEKMPYCNTDHRNYYNRLMEGEELKFPGWIFKSDVYKSHINE